MSGRASAATTCCEWLGKYDEQVDRLARFIMDNVPGEPSQDEDAIDTAIRVLARHYPPSENGSEATS